ncbi:MAG: DUF4345 domain-containing protein [Anaerolineae bacterium CG_4_9_14_3_um_filter_57_17]|nr:DUF4345 domain-containing protein [bacterium]NCT21275.1 DUF4345 domain-containing protein [bacterium]OIO86487.1 MAG: hypothetical protein AUK01_03135 [Anaerolineae bacterium CG2_30_57_67]PJB64468.1 MAG: DUF4345 domain-containing protein [Anaerolineae bacterium CG_4_9_14_3_um_filter_57_17]
MIEMLKLIISFLTLLTGAWSLFSPHSTVGFTGLKPEGGRGVTEIRAVLGGLFIALGLAPLVYRGDTFAMLGFAYLGIAIVRLVSIFVDKSSTQSNWISLAVEIVFGAVLMIGAW